MIGGAALADEDVAGEHDLVAVPLHAETAARTVAPVARGATCFFMRHGRLLLFRRGLFRRLLLRLGSGGRLRGGLKIGFLAIGVDAGDAEHRAELAMAVLAPVVMAALLLEDDDLVALCLLQHGRCDDGAGDPPRPDRLPVAPRPPNLVALHQP